MVEIYREVKETNTAMMSTFADTATILDTATISTLKAQIEELTAEIAQIRRDSEEQVRTLTAQIAQTRNISEEQKTERAL